VHINPTDGNTNDSPFRYPNPDSHTDADPDT
jgi:hypothetical protein